VASSLSGGVILFTGGKSPFAQRISLPWLTDLFLFSGSAPVKTPGAVGRYDAWQRENPGDAARFLEASNALVRGFATAPTKTEAVEIFRRYAELARELGERIGVPATITAPMDTPTGSAVKAIGAGNELGVIWDATTDREWPMRDELERIHVASEGLTWL
jgi:phosphomevalonate kinase